MGLRNYDLDTIVRGLLSGRSDAGRFDSLIAAAEAKLAECGKTPDPSRAVTKIGRHEGRRNPLKGQLLGSADFNGRSVTDWIESITPVADDDKSSDAGLIRKAIDDLVTVHATAKNRAS